MHTSPRHWLEVVDPKDPEQVWHFDLTFLTSTHNCIWGRGCQGAWGAKNEGCCDAGAFFSGEDGDPTQDTPERLQPYVDRLTPETADHHSQIQKRWHGKKHCQEKTLKHKGACIFLNTESKTGCALHKAALQAGEDFRDWKPDICWQIPLRVSEEDIGTVITLWDRDEHGGWNEKAEEGGTGWWCADDPAAYSPGNKPSVAFYAPELIRICGEEVYDIVRKHCANLIYKDAGTPPGQPVAFITKAQAS